MKLRDKLRALFTLDTSRRTPATGEDPLDYDQVVSLDAEDLAEQGILTAYKALLPQLQ